MLRRLAIHAVFGGKEGPLAEVARVPRKLQSGTLCLTESRRYRFDRLRQELSALVERAQAAGTARKYDDRASTDEFIAGFIMAVNVRNTDAVDVSGNTADVSEAATSFLRWRMDNTQNR